MAIYLESFIPELRRFAQSLTGNAEVAEDLTQETLARALRRDHQAPAVANPRAWLFQIAVNTWREWWRARQRDQALVSHLAEQQRVNHGTSMESWPTDIVQHQERLADLADFLQTLPARQREVLLLQLGEQLSASEIADRLQITVSNARAQLSLAKTKLKERWHRRESK